ncbi:MAG: peptidoglycan bridge formation glycyltransferase FemA/FemB family protein [Planctomycetes bacterium]|nr:peptidoglycan bridge formation glycyltransferase FemA/FemB family protein [Planctomycetota bacterium]MBI3833262.1 peptidoglycan bridge formation glycyltransferase FemA/FemB family protein [Planctomycetota bacterium]
MSDEVLVDHLNAEEWSAEARRFSDSNIYQTWAFGEQSAAESGATISRIAIKRGESIVAMTQLMIKRIPMLRTRLAYSYRGPLWEHSGASSSDWRKILSCIRDEYVSRRGLVARIAANLWTFDGEQGDSVGGPEDRLSDFLEGSGFSQEANRVADRTIVLDLYPSIDVLRKNLDQKWRNGLNQSERKGLTIRDGVDDDAIREFEQLYAAMWERKRFEAGVCVSSFRTLQRNLLEHEKQRVALAYLGDELVAGHVSSTLGDTCIYLLGASNDAGRHTKASYLLQWHTLQRAKADGARWYDLGGIDPERNPGVYHFKSGLGGRKATFAPQISASPEGMGKVLAPLAERAHRMLSRVKNRFAESVSLK